MTSFANTTQSSTTNSAPDAQREQQKVSPAPTQARKVQRVSTTSLLEKLYRGATHSLRLLPDFLIIGTQRGGTTSLYHYLQELPCIKLANTKDTHFFDKKYDKGLNWYRGHFPTRLARVYAQRVHGEDFVIGEASPSYLFHPRVPPRVAQALPQVKLIVLLRNPVDRAYSQYYHALELGHETLPFEEAIQAEEERITRERDKILHDEHYYSRAYKHLSYLTRGIYVEQLQAWMKLFPREQFLILKSEDFYADPAMTLKQVLTFLGLAHAESYIEHKQYKQYNNNSYSQMDPELHKRLSEYFKPHNARLYDFLGMDLGWDE
jgi:hypothetical protein